MPRRKNHGAPRRTRAALCAVSGLVLALLFQGCGSPPVSGFSSGAVSWTSTSENGVPGIDSASVTFVTMKSGADELACVVWSDLDRGVSGRGRTHATGAEYIGVHMASNDRRLEFTVSSSDSRTGTLTLAGKTYPLSKGTLFLVTGREDPIAVQPIELDVANLPRGNQELMKFANEDQRIREFFAGPKLAEKPEK